jgi:hypothetical protein
MPEKTIFTRPLGRALIALPPISELCANQSVPRYLPLLALPSYMSLGESSRRTPSHTRTLRQSESASRNRAGRHGKPSYLTKICEGNFHFVEHTVGTGHKGTEPREAIMQQTQVYNASA